MKRVSFLCLVVGMFWATALLAVPSFTPTLDGIKDAGWGSVPDNNSTTLRQPLTFNLDSGMYVTDDAQFIYFGFWGPPDPWTDAKSVHVHVLMDIGSTPDGGPYACWGANSVLYGMPFKPEYDLVAQWNTTDQNISFTGLQRWFAGAWQQQEITTDAGGGGQWTEIAVRRNVIGSPAQNTLLNLSMWLRPTWDRVGGTCCLPADTTFPSDFGNTAGTFHSQWAYTLQSFPGDTVQPQLTGIRQIDRTGLELMFNEPMDSVALRQSGNYTQTGWIFIGFRGYGPNYVWMSAAPPGFVLNSPYTVTCLPGVRDLEGNSIDPAHNSISWNGVGYADVTITAIDQSGLYTRVYFKGSFNNYHEYDSFWNGGNKLMYDDGPGGGHGDPIAGDHQFTLIWPLVPSLTDTFEWGLEDSLGHWLIQGANQRFYIPDTTDIAVSYTLPDVTSSPVTVSFHCDMQFASLPFQSVRLAGSFNGWGGTDFYDANADGVWDTTITFPTGSVTHNEFKFQKVDGATMYWEVIGNDSMLNRTFELDDTQPTQDLGLMWYSDSLDVATLTAWRVGSNVELRWSNYPRVHFNVYASSVPDSVFSEPNLLTPVPISGNTYLYDYSATVKKFFQVVTVP
jgi:hypothetical protein